MKRSFIALAVGSVAAAGLVMAACTAAPAPAPTAAAAPTKAVEPTRTSATPAVAPTPQPTAAPTPQVDFPEKGKAISVVVPYSPGGVDTSARLVAAALEKELGVPFPIINKPGGGTQVGTTDVALAKPDGYTLLYTAFPSIITSYLDVERKAVYNRKSFDTVALTTSDPFTFVVQPDSPIKSMKDLVDAAKANPGSLKMAAGTLMSGNHVAVLLLQKLAGVKFATVHFDGGAQSMAAVIGGHVDAGSSVLSTALPQVKGGQVRVIGVADSQESPFVPGAKTVEAQGYKVYVSSSHLVAVPAGTPKPVIDILSGAIKKVLGNADLERKLQATGLDPRYMDAARVGAYWDQMASDITPVIEQFRQDQK